MFSLMVKRSVKRSLGYWMSSTLSRPKDQFDPLQEAALKERCFLIDDNDKIIGVSSKRDCHLVKPDGSLPLHRAFSVFMFNKMGDFLLQKRASGKVTFPNCYSNSCCSHPIADVPGEDEENQVLGVKRAAQRRLNYELGIPIASIPLEKFNYITRIRYVDVGDGKWGEHEISYILFLQDDLELNPNPNEVSTVKFLAKDELDRFLLNLNEPVTPWFGLISKHCLKSWWSNLNNLKKVEDHTNILDLDKCV